MDSVGVRRNAGHPVHHGGQHYSSKILKARRRETICRLSLQWPQRPWPALPRGPFWGPVSIWSAGDTRTCCGHGRSRAVPPCLCHSSSLFQEKKSICIKDRDREKIVLSAQAQLAQGRFTCFRKKSRSPASFPGICLSTGNSRRGDFAPPAILIICHFILQAADHVSPSYTREPDPDSVGPIDPNAQDTPSALWSASRFHLPRRRIVPR